MASPKRWTAIQTDLLQDCGVFRVSRTLARSPHDGEQHAFFRIDSADWVNIVPITESGKFVMVRQYRHGSDQISFEIPGGMISPGENPAEAARRELLEETGYRAARLISLGEVNPNPALFGNRLHVFVGYNARRVGDVANEGTEETTVELVSPSDVRRLVRDGRIDHALVVSALHLLDLAGESGRRPACPPD